MRIPVFRSRRPRGARPRPAVPRRTLPTLAALAATGLFVSACAGGAGGGGGDTAAGDGYAYGASAEEVETAIADLDPVTLTYQVSATSQNSPQAVAYTEYAETVEERSGGKITLDLAWNQSIASYAEVDDALIDGRIDLALTIPAYDPGQYPAFNAFNEILSGQPSPPLTGDLVTNLTAAEMGFTSPEILDEFESQGLMPLMPVFASGDYYATCAEPATSAEDWEGLQVRVGSPAALAMVEHVGGSPVSIAGVEAYEALQRGTVDCTLALLSDVTQGGFFEVAPNLVHPTTTSFPRVALSIVAGQGVKGLPLAYQQILFDAFDGNFHGTMRMTNEGKADAVAAAHESDVDILEVEPDLQDAIAEFAESTREEVAASGVLGDDVLTRLDERSAHWAERAEELGYTDGGSFEDMSEWYD
ncbi:TRAP transporter substrate-binding protein DctP, partial [Brevibacterium litoralis]|uniref:TRAP transporter substrate-binding protein DctP n=1 Tax=Brevibacterium litoralis TaxID=3138935 RepID=UPI0032EE2227